ncbi:hypothetical protein WBG99_05020 [Streptomyces sp. TG1A-60]|uniref:hypothetical protein n=1 Tax=Streptomyces sp. TG1A-60 TaxID=3129111 RepID=UPI0030D27BCF
MQAPPASTGRAGPTELAAYAGRRVETGSEAHAYAEFIKGNRRHCRAEVVPGRAPRELDTVAAKDLLDQVAAFGQPPRCS